MMSQQNAEQHKPKLNKPAWANGPGSKTPSVALPLPLLLLMSLSILPAPSPSPFPSVPVPILSLSLSLSLSLPPLFPSTFALSSPPSLPLHRSRKHVRPWCYVSKCMESLCIAYSNYIVVCHSISYHIILSSLSLFRCTLYRITWTDSHLHGGIRHRDRTIQSCVLVLSGIDNRSLLTHLK